MITVISADDPDYDVDDVWAFSDFSLEPDQLFRIILYHQDQPYTLKTT